LEKNCRRRKKTKEFSFEPKSQKAKAIYTGNDIAPPPPKKHYMRGVLLLECLKLKSEKWGPALRCARRGAGRAKKTHKKSKKLIFSQFHDREKL
jgi:hypothetical protein